MYDEVSIEVINDFVIYFSLYAESDPFMVHVSLGVGK